MNDEFLTQLIAFDTEDEEIFDEEEEDEEDEGLDGDDDGSGVDYRSL
jgi:hypothetical protein